MAHLGPWTCRCTEEIVRMKDYDTPISLYHHHNEEYFRTKEPHSVPTTETEIARWYLQGYTIQWDDDVEEDEDV